MEKVTLHVWDYAAKAHRQITVGIQVNYAQLAADKAQKAFDNKHKRTKLASGAVVLKVLA